MEAPSCPLSRRCNRDAIDYSPVVRDDRPVSTPEAQGLDPELVTDLYCAAERESTLYSLLVAKDGYLVAEEYYNLGSIDQRGNRQSVTKSFTSALVGLAIEDGCLSGTDAKMMDFFPEYVDEIQDSRKEQITVEQLLQMRGGYPWEESADEYYQMLLTGWFLEPMIDLPLATDPGTAWAYSNFSSHWLCVILARACDTDLHAFGQQHLFGPLGMAVQPWTQDFDGYTLGFTEIEVSARDMARFGQAYLDGGVYDGQQVLPADWVQASLSSYSTVTGPLAPGPQLDDYGYGYQWWSATAGDHHVDFAWGHGGQFIFLVDDLDLIVVVTGDPFYHQNDGESWRHEKGQMNMAAKFISHIEP